jgi:hypothetical protein
LLLFLVVIALDNWTINDHEQVSEKAESRCW